MTEPLQAHILGPLIGWAEAEAVVNAIARDARQSDDRLREAARRMDAALAFHNRTPSGKTHECLAGCIACQVREEYAAALASHPTPSGTPDRERLAALLRDAGHQVGASGWDWERMADRLLAAGVAAPSLDVEALAEALHHVGVGCDFGMTGRKCGSADLRLPRPAHETQAAAIAREYQRIMEERR